MTFPTATQPPQKSQRTWSKASTTALALAVALISMLACGAGGYMYWTRGTTPEASSETEPNTPAETESTPAGSALPTTAEQKKLDPAIRSFDVSNQAWPAWTRVKEDAHDSRFSTTEQLSGGRHFDPDSQSYPHTFCIDPNVGPAYADVNGDGYEDAAYGYIGNHGRDCNPGPKANYYVIVWVWDPGAGRANPIYEPAVDLPYTGSDTVSLSSTGEGLQVKVDYHAAGSVYHANKTIGVSGSHLVRTDAVGGWGGWCIPLTVPPSVTPQSASQVTLAPDASAPEAPDWHDATAFMPASITVGSDHSTIDDGWAMITYQRPGVDQPTCAWAR